ncbi:MAG: endonuclease 4 [Candidatus Woesearchaeota archaeon]|nr:endonuclease 4 [Candidatus Woesearchaeota archaeon]
MEKLRFGTAGIPISTIKRDSVEGVKRVSELNLECMELEFVRGVNLGQEKAEQIKKIAQKLDISLTAHGPYYINLNAKEPQKRGASRSRILKTARAANWAGAKSITFHAAYYLKQDPKQVYAKVKEQFKKILDVLNNEGNKVMIRPELTGKATQWGDIDELIKLSQEFEQVLPCVDFAHYHARHIGKYNSYEGFVRILEKIEKGLGREALDNMHIHVSGILYSDKGERKHLPLKESDLKYKQMIKAWKEFNIKGIVISESPNIEQDAQLLRDIW